MHRPPKATATSAPIRSSPPRAISRSWARAPARIRHPQLATLSGSCRRRSPSARIRQRRGRGSRAVEAPTQSFAEPRAAGRPQGAAGTDLNIYYTPVGDFSQARAGRAWEHEEMTMNATRTTPKQALPRWQRGILRAVLLMGALVGMTL